MAWDFETDPEYQELLDWAAEFVRREVEPLDFVIPHPTDRSDPVREELIPPLQAEVRQHGLWATHLGPELGGPGYGQVKLALLNEILGRSRCAPVVFGSQAPDSGNGEILAHFGSDALKGRYLRPLLDGEVFSAFSMTEPQGGSDPKVFTTQAHRDGTDWVINGYKWFSTNARLSDFLVVMAVTDPDASPYRRMSMFVVPTTTPGVSFVRNLGMGYEPVGDGVEGYVRYEDVRVPGDHLLGGRGDGFVVAQTRLGGGRIHHCMRTVGLVQRALEMMSERAVSRTTQGEMLGNKQLVQQMIADSWVQIESFRLLTLRTAWRIDRYNDYRRVRGDISAVKAFMQTVAHDVVERAIQIHGSLGVTNEMPFVRWLVESFVLGLADGPTEVHKLTLARELLRDVTPADDLFPTGHLPRLAAQSEARFADVLARHGRLTGAAARSAA
jgi:acyl-CoA dehydrogenase